MPAAISESVAAVLRAHGLSLSPEVLGELGRNATQALLALEVTDPKPQAGDRLAVGETLRALAAAGRPNVHTAEALACVGEWLSATARAEIDQQREAATLLERALRNGMPPSGRFA